MSEGGKPRGYLAKYGARLIDGGYRIVPILRGEKVPPLPKWTKIDATKRTLKAWLADQHNGRPFRGLGAASVGIQTRDTPFVDIDVRDEAVSKALEEFCHERIGLAPVRVGRAPKRGLLFRTSEPFRKITSNAYTDDDGNKAQVEILGDGQQFVAFAIHESTGKPYQWLYQDGPHKTEAAELPEITEEQAREIVAEFERIAEEREWSRLRKQRDNALAPAGPVDRDDPFADFAEKTQIDEDELHRRLMLVPPAEDYETWFQIGMALHHQFDGEAKGLEWWHEWSSGASNYDEGECEEKWPTFAIEGKGHAPLTARYILRLSKEFAAEETREKVEQARVDLDFCADLPNLREVCARLKRMEFEPLIRHQFVKLVQRKFKAITNDELPIGLARDMLRFERRPDTENMPRWLSGYVYCQQDEIFYNRLTCVALSTKAFNDAYCRHLLTDQEKAEGQTRPEQLPSDVALNLYEIPVVYRRAYLPGEEELFWLNGLRYVNTYDGRNVPEVPETPTRAERRNVERVFLHFEHLFSVEKDRRLLIDSIAYLVQNPGKRLNYALLMQGTRGDGKTFIFRLLAAMLGMENVTTIGPQAVEEKFTGWAEGHQIVFVEEIKLHGHNRYDVLNKLKPLITNPLIPVRRMNVDTYNVINTSTYFLATNHKDALPLDDDENRYAVLFSRFQTKRQLRVFMDENPTYYDDLHDALAESAGAIRKSFLEWEISETFRPHGRAPETEAAKEMVAYAKSEEQHALDAVLAEGRRLDMTPTLLNVTELADEFDRHDCALPYGKALTKLLLDANFTKLGKFRIEDDRQCAYWSQEPGRFTARGASGVRAAIREWLSDDL